MDCILVTLKFFWRLYYENLRKYNLIKFQYKWRQDNKHNATIPLSIFPSESVIVGKSSYGYLNIHTFKNPNEKLIIGNYVSIADNVSFILGGNHQINTITTYPLYSKLITLSPTHDATSKGPIIIEDDVWIGYNAIILSGIRIGRGSIIAAGSVITKDIPPFAIVGGNPAKIIKYRFNETIIGSIENITISEFDDKVIIENIKDYYHPIDIIQIEKLKNFKREKDE